MRKYFDSIIGSDGRPVAGASVEVTPFGGGALSAIFSDSAGASPKVNPISTDTNGYFEFYAADGRYTLTVSASGFGTRTLTDIALEDPADPSQATINGGSINNTPIGATTPNSGAFTTLSASGGITGSLTGNSAGTHTGPVVGNVTGDLAGNVTGNTAGTHTGPVTGAVTGNVTGNLTGNADTATTATNQAGGTVSALSIGYATGAGGTVTQTTSKSTGVTLNEMFGKITLDAESLADGATASFVLTNSNITSDDVLILTLSGAMGSMTHYNIWGYVQSGSAVIAIKNISGGALANSPTINFAVVKGVTT